MDEVAHFVTGGFAVFACFVVFERKIALRSLRETSRTKLFVESGVV